MQSVLHIVENLDRGAVEGWLLRMLAHARLRGVSVDWSFYCTLGREGAQDKTAHSLGARVIHSPVPMVQKIAFARALRAELRRGRYAVLHCHHDLVSALYLVASAGLPIARRIVHVHNADEAVPTPNLVKRRLFREPARRICLALSGRIVGISDHTLDTFLCGRRRQPDRDVVHYYGVDPTPFYAASADRRGFRQRLNLPPDALILLFGGRLVPEKNPVFVIEVLVRLRHIEPRAVAVFAGAGSLEQEVQARARELGVGDAVRLLGWRNDLPEIMSGSDWFILPHPELPMEGFGLAVVEAQLAGLRLLLSRGIAADPLLPSASFRRLALADGAERWAKAALELLRAPRPSRQDALAALRQSPMDMDRAFNELLALHAYA
jgi:glycosyltransferase involved in cell wall biosynthesis